MLPHFLTPTHPRRQPVLFKIHITLLFVQVSEASCSINFFEGRMDRKIFPVLSGGWQAGFLINSFYMHVQGWYLWLPGSIRNCSFPAESAKVIFEIKVCQSQWWQRSFNRITYPKFCLKCFRVQRSKFQEVCRCQLSSLWLPGLPNELQARLNLTKVPHFTFFSGEVKQISLNLLIFDRIQLR